jgi:hypothetical protein
MLKKVAVLIALMPTPLVFGTFAYAGAANSAMQELINRPQQYTAPYDAYNYDHQVNGSDASTPGHN